MKWLLTITLAVVLCGCSSSSAEASQLSSEVKTSAVKHSLNLIPKRSWLGDFVVSGATAVSNRDKLNKVVIRLIHRVGKTPYVFSGSSIYGWDCSGMVRWAYGELGVELPHSATKQAYEGRRVSKQERKVGDVVIFAYRGSKTIYHSAIYIGKDKVINANRGFGGTHIQSLKDYANSRIIYVRIIETP